MLALEFGTAGNIIAFLSGISLSWTSPELNAFSKYSTFDHTLSKTEESWISSLTPLGAVIGPVFFGFLGDAVGRKYALLSVGVPFFISFVMLASAHTVILFYIARFLCGFAVGGSFTLIPMYTGEVADDKYRAVLASSMNVFICFGLLFSYMIGPYISVTWFNVILAVLPVIFLIVFFFLGTESAHYYIAKKQDSLAKNVLHKIRGNSGTAEREFKETKENIEREGEGNIVDIFRSAGLRKALIISVGLVSFQQLSGINALLFYAQTIFKKADVPLSPAVCSILIGLTQFSTSFITPLVANRFGRKTLLIFSAVGMVIFEIPLGIYCYLLENNNDVSSISWMPVMCLILYIVVYNVGFGPLPWAVLAELFPANVKASASILTASACWLFGFLITNYFQSISDAIGMGASFWIFAGFSAAAIFFVAFIVIETKDKSLQDIQDSLN